MAEHKTGPAEVLFATAGEHSEGSSIRFFFILIMLAGIVIGGYELFRYYEYREPELDYSQTVNADTDKSRLDKMIQDIRSSISARERSAELVNVAFASSRYPFGAPPGLLAGGGSGQIDSFEQVVVEQVEIPPMIEVKGILLMGKTVVAMMNIEGETNNKIYRVGDRFNGKSGRVVKIDRNNVTVRYNGKNFSYSY